MENEVWKDIKGYEGRYQVSNYGNVKSLKYRHHNKISLLKKYKSFNYYRVALGKTHKKFFIHRLVAEAFIPNPHNLPFINHKDENGLNNYFENLEWCTQSYNINYGTRNERVAQKKRRLIAQYNLNGEIIKTWASGTAIEKELKFYHSNIIKCCKKEIDTAYGYKWKYADEELQKIN